MSNKYVLGNAVTLPATYTQLTDAFAGTYTAYDPALPTLIVKDPTGIKVPYTYPASPSIARPAGATGTGKYYAVIVPNVAGTWTYQWSDPAVASPGLVENTFVVVAAKIT